MKCIVELMGDDPNGRKMIAWGRRIGYADAGHGFDPSVRKVVTKLLVDDSVPSQHSWILPAIPRPPRHQPGMMRTECLATPDVSAVGEKLKVKVKSKKVRSCSCR